MEHFEVLVAIVTVLAAVLLFIGTIAYKTERSWRLLLADLVFAVFLLKGIIMSISIFFPGLETTSDSPTFHLLFDVVVLLFLFFAVIKAPKSRKKAFSALEDAEEGKS